jgi:hypothetical protein
MPEINKHYQVKEGEEKYPRMAMVKTMIFKKIKQIKYYTKAASYLKENLIDAIELGFNVDKSGNVILPDHETLRHFEKVRLGNEGMDSIMTAFCKKVVEAGNKNGLKIGRNTGTDSTPIEVPNDPAGTYNGHYKKIMVKMHITSDYDNNIPLTKKNMEDTWYDGGYNSNKNIALSQVEFGLTAHYHIDAGWRQNVKYELKEEVYEPVAMHFRNARIREFEECPDGILDVYHRRNCSME